MAQQSTTSSTGAPSHLATCQQHLVAQHACCLLVAESCRPADQSADRERLLWCGLGHCSPAIQRTAHASLVGCCLPQACRKLMGEAAAARVLPTEVGQLLQERVAVCDQGIALEGCVGSAAVVSAGFRNSLVHVVGAHGIESCSEVSNQGTAASQAKVMTLHPVGLNNQAYQSACASLHAASEASSTCRYHLHHTSYTGFAHAMHCCHFLLCV